MTDAWPVSEIGLLFLTQNTTQYVAHVEEATVQRQVTDREGAVMSAVGKWSASKVS